MYGIFMDIWHLDAWRQIGIHKDGVLDDGVLRRSGSRIVFSFAWVLPEFWTVVWIMAIQVIASSHMSGKDKAKLCNLGEFVLYHFSCPDVSVVKAGAETQRCKNSTRTSERKGILASEAFLSFGQAPKPPLSMPTRVKLPTERNRSLQTCLVWRWLPLISCYFIWIFIYPANIFHGGFTLSTWQVSDLGSWSMNWGDEIMEHGSPKWSLYRCTDVLQNFHRATSFLTLFCFLFHFFWGILGGAP